ncbi:MAG: dTDP-glucose 4,6-dehydratase, partial [Rhodothermia bacterium]|nr:dTDP-glucose 4,6-dehydratase [Rhodothermia bacterium]
MLVTGGAGFIGSNFIHYMLRCSDARLVTLDALTYAGLRENLEHLPDSSRHAFVHGDICDRELVWSIFDNHQIDTVVHFAAESHVDRSIVAPGRFIETNVVGTMNLLEAARNRWPDQAGYHRFHHVSTDEVYGTLEPEEPAFTESTPYDPSSPYSASKAASDHLVRAYHRTYGLPVTISNCSNNYGPRQLPEKLIPLTILRALRGEEIPVYGDGMQVRDWLYVDDHCGAINSILRGGREGETYNVGGGNQPANLSIVESICEILDELVGVQSKGPRESLITFVADRPGHDRRYAIDFSKIESELGWSPKETLEAGLRKTVKW